MTKEDLKLVPSKQKAELLIDVKLRKYGLQDIGKYKTNLSVDLLRDVCFVRCLVLSSSFI